MQKAGIQAKLLCFLPFLSNGFLSLVGILQGWQILRDNGLDSFVLASVLLFSQEGSIGDLPAHGMGLQVFPVPLHKVMLVCGLVGEVRLFVRLALLKIAVILGNGQAGIVVFGLLFLPPSSALNNI